jgi:hypothetical protein
MPGRVELVVFVEERHVERCNRRFYVTAKDIPPGDIR